MSATLHIVDLWQYYVCRTKSGVIRCILFVLLYLYRMCRCGLHAALWSHIATLMSLFYAGLSFPCQYLCGMILVTRYSMVWDRRVSRAGPTPLYWPSCSLPFCPFLFFHSMGWYCGAGVFGLIGYQSLSPNNNNNNNLRIDVCERPVHSIRLINIVGFNCSLW